MATHVYWRLYITASQGIPSGKDYWHTMAEIELRATPGGADQCSGGTATAHDYYSAAYAPAKAFDNANATYWGSWPGSNLGNGWINYQFASAVAVAEVAITARNDPGLTDYGPKTFQLQWSDNNSTWNTLASWENIAPWGQGESRLFQPPVVVDSQCRTPYGLWVACWVARRYGEAVAASRSRQRYGDWQDERTAQLGCGYGPWQADGARDMGYGSLAAASQTRQGYDPDTPGGQRAMAYDGCLPVAEQGGQGYDGNRLEQVWRCPIHHRMAQTMAAAWSLQTSLAGQWATGWCATTPLAGQGRAPWALLAATPVQGQWLAGWAVREAETPSAAGVVVTVYHRGVRL